MHYVVQVMLEIGIYKDFEFFTLEEATEWYRHLDRGFKRLYQVNMDGTRTKLAEVSHFTRSFDYTATILDIKSIPCNQLKISGHDAYAERSNAIYHYKKHPKYEEWKLAAIYGTESEYEYSY